MADRRHRRGRLITIEGIDGSGKSTLAAGLAGTLAQRGVPVTSLREPGGVALSERIRTLVTDPSLRIDPRGEALLYAGARAQLVDERILPAMRTGEWVLLDRFTDSSLAYQGAGRGLGIEEVREINRFATGGLIPDRTLLITIDLQTGRGRASHRGTGPDRLEREGDEFFTAIADAYQALALREPGRIRVIDGRMSPEDVLGAAVEALGDLLEEVGR